MAASHTRTPSAWQQIIDERLVACGQHADLADDDLQPPTAEVLDRACEFAAFCRDHGVDPPLRVVPNGAGGVVFEWRARPYFHTVEIRADGGAELLVFENSKLLTREAIG
jgi:hypothetical protein